MRHKLKRALSAALACVMVLALLPATALAAGELDNTEIVIKYTNGGTDYVISAQKQGDNLSTSALNGVALSSADLSLCRFYLKAIDNSSYYYIAINYTGTTYYLYGSHDQYLTTSIDSAIKWIVNTNGDGSITSIVPSNRLRETLCVDLSNGRFGGLETEGLPKDDHTAVVLTKVFNNVIYSYTGTVPANAPSVPVTERKELNSTVTVAPAPTLTGYTFSGWTESVPTGATAVTITTDANGNQTFTMPDRNVTLTGSWTADTYTVTYYANGGSGAPDSQTKTHDVDLTLSSTTPTRSGYTFDSWNTSTDGSGTRYAAGGTYTLNADLTLYAQWTADTYTVTYNANGGSGAPDSQTKTHDVDLTLSSTTPTRSGYTFDSWNTSTDGSGTRYAAGGTYTLNADLTLYAQWTADTYTVTYNANGGSGAPDSQTKTHDVDLTLSSTTPTRSGYTFDSWNTSTDGSGTRYAAGDTYTLNADLTLYAQWNVRTDLSYTVNYIDEDTNKAIHDAKVEDNQTFGTVITSANEVITIDGYVHVRADKETLTIGTGENVINLYYTKDIWNDEKNSDEEGDGIPDKYQVLINYVSANENQGSVNPAKEVVTLYKQSDDGAWERIADAAAAGSTATPKSGYTFVNWINNDGTEEATTAQYVPSIENAEGGETYTFTANFTAIYYPPVVIPDPTIKVKGLNTVDHVTYIIGVGNDKVNPMGTITRAEIAAIYFRLMTDEFRSANWSTENRFKDVPDNAWYTMAILTLDKAGVITDSDNGNFRPNEPITRAELAVMAAQFCTVTGNIPRTSFKDVPADHWAAKEIALIEYAGWIEGYAGYFRPDDNLTRAEAVTIVNRMLQRGAEDENMLPNMVTFVDNTPDMWYYEAIQEAANCHDYTRTTKLLTGETFRGEKWTALLEATDWAALEKAWIEANS
ncbi:MAG: InlB B-repeat-containing protein [Oscillospiraceae bacterium]